LKRGRFLKLKQQQQQEDFLIKKNLGGASRDNKSLIWKSFFLEVCVSHGHVAPGLELAETCWISVLKAGDFLRLCHVEGADVEPNMAFPM